MKFDTKAKQAGLKSHIIHMGIFDVYIRLVVGNYRKSVGVINWFMDTDYADDTEPKGECYYRQGYCPTIWLPRNPRTAEELGTFAHEASHAALAMFDHLNVPHDRSTDEMFAHAVGYIVTEFKKALQ